MPTETDYRAGREAETAERARLRRVAFSALERVCAEGHDTGETQAAITLLNSLERRVTLGEALTPATAQ